MKKCAFLSLILLLSIAAHLSGQQLNVAEAVRFDGVVTVQDLKPVVKIVHPVAARAMVSGEQPGAFKDVRYDLAPNVRILSPAQKSRIRLVQDGILDLSGGAFKPSPDSIYFDPASDLVMQAAPVDDNEMIALRPSLAAVFQDIDVPEQTVPVRLANTISLAEGLLASAMGMNNNYAVNLQFDSVTYLVDKANKDSLTVTLVGKIQLTNPRIEGKYSRNSGYRLVFLASEEIDMKIYASMNMKEEVKTPIWGTVIEMADIGKCEIGLFILATMEGKLTLAVEINQGINMSMGAKGGTFWFLPTSIHNISTIDSWCDIDYNVASQMKAFIGFQCTANMKIKGYNALDVYVNGGMEGTVNTDGLNLDVDLGLRLKAGGKVVSKKFTLVDTYYSLWKYQKPDFHGYDMKIHEACAWGDYVAGEVRSLIPSKTLAGGMDTIPYAGPLKVIVRHPDNSTVEYNATAESDGIFIAKDVPLKNGDKVMVKLPGVPNPSPAVDASIPFSEIKLWSADYYTGIADGSVAGSKSKWARLAGKQTGASAAAAAGLVGNSPADRLKQTIQKPEAIKRLEEFRNNLTVYRGPIEFITQSVPQATLTGPRTFGNAPQGSATQGAAAQGSRVAGTATPGTRAQAGVSQASRDQAMATAEKSRPNKGTVDSPMGMFAVSGLTFEPGQKVKARIMVEGFTIESDWIETDGLMVSAIEHDGLNTSVGPRAETISAGNSFVVVSAIRGQTPPVGTVKMVKGAEAPHASLTGPQPVPEFPEAKKAKVWFSKSIPLVPLEDNPGSAIASTGPWSVAYNYLSPGDAIDPHKNGKHPFEMVTYVYKNKNFGYSSFINECASCTSAVNVVENIGKALKPDAVNNPDRPDMHDRPNIQQKVNVPVKNQLLQKTTVIR